MINVQKSYVAKLEFKLATPGSAVRWPTDHAIETGLEFGIRINNALLFHYIAKYLNILFTTLCYILF